TIDGSGGDETALDVVLVAEMHAAQLIVSAASDATVLVDHVRIAKGRFEGALPAGPHEVQISAPGKKSYDARIDLRAGEVRTLGVTLESAPPRLGVWPW